MSIERHRERIASLVRELVETNAAGSLDEVQASVNQALGLDPGSKAQQELRALIQAVYDEYQRANEFDYDDIVEQSFPASDPPPPPAP